VRLARTCVRTILLGVALGGVGAGGLIASAAPSSAADKTLKMRFSSDRDAYFQGISGYRAGDLKIAVPALTFAASHGVLAARSYLARIYADEKTPYTDHARAYKLFMSIIETHGDVDPDDLRAAPYVAHAWTALGAYARDGVAELKIKPDISKAAAYFQYAAQEYNDPAAQFELAKLYLTRFQVAEKTRLALHWLAVLSRQGHAGAQAYLADLMWRGKFTKKDPKRALALISVAVVNASPRNRDWIEDIHQNIYCGTSPNVRSQASGLVANWRKKFGRQEVDNDKLGLETLGARPLRICDDGNPVIPSVGPTQLPVATPPRQGPAIETDLSVLFGGLAITGITGSTKRSATPAK
jgi:exopolysaccharide production negative regulator